MVEKWNPFAKKRIDAWGFADILAFKTDMTGVLAVNSCSASSVSEHVKKYKNMKDLAEFMCAGNSFEIHGWHPWTDEDKRDEVIIREVVGFGCKEVCFK